ncbi:MAG: Amuc_1100 family pilus-like protein [Kiritimatiellae bacterium]|nr:Amuc_1100 family pilus-like protein [Kiritimatiellia bacterium]MDW8458363.1 Amuc_1100 family pilus-like protein [Verrucomicrobiota bacterium]
MNWRKHSVLFIGGGVALLFLVAALIFLFQARSQYRRANDSLESVLRSLEMLSRRDPYPSEANIRKVGENLETLRSKASEVQRVLEAGRFQEEAIEAADFAPLLEKTIARIVQKAMEAGVQLPDRFSLGMPQYLAGEIPSSDAIPRLVSQLKTLESLCNLLIQARVSSILHVERQAFEAPAQAPVEQAEPVRRRRAALAEQETQLPAVDLPMPSENDLYRVERVRVSFTARDAAIWEVLNSLARGPLIAAVADVRLSNTIAEKIGRAQPVSPITGEAGSPTAIVRYPTHEERVIAGRELVQADLVIDVYQFVKDLKEETP